MASGRPPAIDDDSFRTYADDTSPTLDVDFAALGLDDADAFATIAEDQPPQSVLRGKRRAAPVVIEPVPEPSAVLEIHERVHGRPTPERPRAFEEGTVLRTDNGRYILGAPLGSSDYSASSVAYPVTGGDRVAPVVVRHLSVGIGPEAEIRRAAFMNRVRIARQLDHPNITPVDDSGWFAGQPFLVRRLVQGMPVSDFIDAYPAVGVRTICEILRQVAMAFAYLHTSARSSNRADITVHGEIAASNILVGRDGRVRITEPADGWGCFGPEHYRAPEMAASSRSPVSTDLYAVGVVGLEMLCGLHFGRIQTGLKSQVMRRLAGRSNVPKRVLDLTYALTDPNPEARPASAHVVVQTLQQVLTASGGAVDLAGLLAPALNQAMSHSRRGRSSTIVGPAPTVERAKASPPPPPPPSRSGSIPDDRALVCPPASRRIVRLSARPPPLVVAAVETGQSAAAASLEVPGHDFGVLIPPNELMSAASSRVNWSALFAEPGPTTSRATSPVSLEASSISAEAPLPTGTRGGPPDWLAWSLLAASAALIIAVALLASGL